HWPRHEARHPQGGAALGARASARGRERRRSGEAQMMPESVLNVDAPVTLDELLDKNARDTLGLGARDLGTDIAILDRQARLVLGTPPPAEVAATAPDEDARVIVTEGRRYVVERILHEGDTIGALVVGPFSCDDDSPARRTAAHLSRVADAFLLEGMRRVMSARMHMATVEEANRELTEKNRRLAQ